MKIVTYNSSNTYPVSSICTKHPSDVRTHLRLTPRRAAEELKIIGGGVCRHSPGYESELGNITPGRIKKGMSPFAE